MGTGRRGLDQDLTKQLRHDALEMNGASLFSTGFRFVRIIDDSDPSGPVELLCLIDGSGNILMSIVLASRNSAMTSVPGSFDGDLSAPVSYTTR